MASDLKALEERISRFIGDALIEFKSGTERKDWATASMDMADEIIRWVADVVEDATSAALAGAEQATTDARRQVAAVRQLHQQYRDVYATAESGDSCSECNTHAEFRVPWPCPRRAVRRVGRPQHRTAQGAGTAEEADVVITESGLYEIDADLYHADPVAGGSLTSSGAVKLLEGCPAKFDYDRRHPLPPKDVLDFGSAAHRYVLSAGRDIVEVKANDWLTKKAKEAKAEAHAEGKIPLLSKNLLVVKAMAAAIARHPMAAALLNPDRGTPEQTLVWQDPATGVWCRAMVDLLPHPTDGRYVLAEYKSAADASPAGFAKAAFNLNYLQRAEWYLRGAKQVLGDAAIVIVAQEKTPPYLPYCAEPDHIALRYGRDRNDEALTIYAACTEQGRWPGYGDDIGVLSLPDWLTNRYLRGDVW